MTDSEGVVRDLVEKVKKSAGIDTRFVVLDFSAKKKGTMLQIDFTVSNAFIAKAVHQFFEKHRSTLGSSVTHTVRILERSSRNEEASVICNVTVAPLRHAPAHRSEQTTQMLLGETADLLETGVNGWLRVRNDLDGYVGWIARNQVVIPTKKELRHWRKSAKLTARELSLSLREEPSKNADPAGEMLQGSYLPKIRVRGAWTSVRMPDGREGWGPSASLVKPGRPVKSVTSAEIVASAKSFLGISYVWGGRSVKGFDCSGFTQTVFGNHGIELPRDASLQWRCGHHAGKDLKELVEGDLLFFSAREHRITHVAIYLGVDGTLIHSSGYVRIGSLDPENKLFDEDLARTFVGARRLGEVS